MGQIHERIKSANKHKNLNPRPWYPISLRKTPTQSIPTTHTLSLSLARPRQSNLTKLNEQESITAGWVISGVENQPCSLPLPQPPLVVTLATDACGARHLASITLASEPTRFTSSPAVQPKDLSDKRRGSGGDNILHIML